MQPREDTNNQPQQQPLRQRSGEKVIQPLNPIIVPPAAVAPAQPSVATPAVNPTLNTHNPTSNGDIYQAPGLEYRKPPEDSTPKSVAMQHTSLLVLAILGLVSTVFSIWSLLQLNRAVQHSLAINPNQNTGSAIAILYFLWGAAAFNLAVFTYLLFAKNVHTVTTILRILLVLQFITVFGVFFGGSPAKGANAVIDAARLLYLYIVYQVVKTPPAM